MNLYEEHGIMFITWCRNKFGEFHEALLVESPALCLVQERREGGKYIGTKIKRIENINELS